MSSWRKPGVVGAVLYAAAAAVVGAVLALVSRRTVSTVRERAGEVAQLPTGPLIVVSNHTSYADAFLMGLAARRLGRSLRMLGTSGIVEAPLLRMLTRRLGFISVRRHGADAAAALEPAADALRAGEAVLIYPEGRTTRDPDHWPERGKTGAVRLALETGAPILPIASEGAHRVVGRRAMLRSLFVNVIRRPKVHLRVGEPIDVRRLLDLRPEEEATPDQVRSATDVMMRRLTVMVADLRGEPVPVR
jgi:1-acyl-sn-glycerol-3-phosphate acyltransferase